MKTISTLAILLISTQISVAQENKLFISLGAGVNQGSKENKNILIGNGTNLQLDAFVPFYRKGWDGTVKGGSFELGINAMGNYARVKNLSPNNLLVEEQYKVFGGTLAATSQANSKASSSFAGLLGLQGRFSFGKINISPSLNAGYLSFKKAGYEQIGNVSVNGQARQLDLVRVEEQNSGGFVFKPQVKVGYNLTSNLSVFVSPALIMGHEVAHTVQQRVPQGGFNDRNTYEATQLANGTWESKTSNSKYKFSELNFGLSVALGKKKGGNEQARRRVEVLKSNKMGDSQNMVKEEKNTSDIAKPDTTAASLRLSMTPTSTKQTQGKTFGESMAGGLQTAGNTVGNEGGEAEARRRVEVLKSNKTGDPNKYAVNEDKNAEGKSISQKGMKRSDTNESENAEALNTKSTPRHDIQMGAIRNIKARTTNPNENGSGKSIRSIGVKRSDIVAAPGQPIGGIVVKGGKNPGGSTINSLTNANGEITFTITTPGEYKLQVLEPQSNEQARVATYKKKGVKTTAETVAPTTQKSISEKGVKRTEADAIVLGNPIGGVIVKGGKNPGGGNMINAVADENGEITFTANEVGEYQIQVLAPEAGQEMRVSGLKSKGVKRTEVESSTNEFGGATGGVVNKQSQGQNFGEKVATGLQPGANLVGQGASLLGGAMPTGSTTKRSATSNEQTPASPQKNEAQDFNTTRNNKERGQLVVHPDAAPGSPIGGIVVKGGKNPGGNMRLISNGNGEVLLENLQKGSYLFQLNEPSGKSISQKGVKRTDANAMEAPGQPIKGVIVKGGKNPGRNYINLTVNNKGQIGFDVQEAGNYKLIIQTSEAPKTNGNSEKKVVEKATSGLKDTLKTNV